MSLAVHLAGLVSGQVPDIPVSGYALDHRRVEPGTVFVALQGTRQHGLHFADAAVTSGAVAVLYEPEGAGSLPGLDVPLLPVPGLGHKLGLLAARFYGHASEDLLMVGVTGTDGKTSVTHFIAEALTVCGQSAAVIGTLGSGVPGALNASTHTTPDAIQVQALLAMLREQGCQSVSMEVSSHALAQGRVEGVRFDTVVLTNLTRDHLDYHGSEAAYAEAKQRLFFWPGLKHVVLNQDDAFGRRLMQQLQGSAVRVLPYGVAGAPGEAGVVSAHRARF
ncbi:MAG: UDP-N-acetylmuramoyl-L-alanyl-D-glutamate--2,6-diaminopimelate ligase, partial [Thiothrix sp.]|nr:UDP-N-acetylmuramoyl-L-alanyl-D-glutamate--2,6-diaminopimelate ligase [Thiothrix sp.]